MSDPIRIFIATEDAQELPAEVLRRSITHRTDADLEFHELKNMKCGLEDRFYTGFSFYRWAIPQECGYKGRAIYLDADILCNGDIKRLWDFHLGKHTHLARPGFGNRSSFCSVMLIDCERAKWPFKKWCAMVKDDRNLYKAIMWARTGETMDGIGPLPAGFNAMDHNRKFDCDKEQGLFFHYTVVRTQPWRFGQHANGQWWYAELSRCVSEGLDPRPMIEKAKSLGKPYSPDLKYHIEAGVKMREFMNA